MGNRVNKYLFSPEEQWVLQSITGKKDPDDLSMNIEHMHAFTLKNGLAPYLFNQYKNKKATLPEQIIAKLKKDYLTSLMRSTRLLAIWQEIKTLFEENGLAPIPLKGIVLATQVYPDPTLRPMSDLDILFIDHQSQKAFELLIAHGGICHEEEAEHDKKTGHQLPGITYKGIMIEIHRSLFDTDLQYIIPNTYLKKNLISSNDITTFTPEINFIYFSLHAYHTMRRGGIRLSWFLDLLLLSQKQSINTELFIQIITELKLTAPIQQITAQTEYLFNKPFSFLPESFRKPLTQKEKNDLIQLIHSSDQQDTNFSYAIAIERLKNTKGLSGKITFLKSILTKDTQNTLEILKRTLYLSIKLGNHLIHRIK